MTAAGAKKDNPSWLQSVLEPDSKVKVDTALAEKVMLDELRTNPVIDEQIRRNPTIMKELRKAIERALAR